jgi:chromosome segregation ATPase
MNEDNGKGYGCFVMFVSGVAIIFSVTALLRHDNWDCEISPAGFVIATLSALITFVVAWQIWQTIASREEIKEAHKEVENIKGEVEKYKNGTETKITNLKTELDKLNDQFTNKLNLHEIHHRGLLKRIQGESQFIDSDFINACISFADAANDYIDSQSNHATHISPCANWIRRCIQSIHDISESDVPSVNDAIRRIDILLSKINSTTSVLKEERMTLSHSKEQLEILMNRATSTES